ncbi:YdbL family protein [Kangiella sp. TOML190]|uniref:YdbL family protein n=1 Tax=Kangiella sp. TOML190 TaxID=2931351 RepID=UPI00203D1366|nr:YdbL family protein [Kangiella sp. TOML190]
MKKLTLFLTSILFSGTVLAASIGDLKSQGVIGELANGYVGLVSSNANADAKKLVADVNVKRKAIYLKQAKKNNIPLTEVEKIAAKRNIEKTEKGHYVNVSGSWVKK